VSHKPKRRLSYLAIARPDRTYTVETSDGTNVIINTKGFRNEIAANTGVRWPNRR
jgi:hypothetical protein